MPLCRMFLLLTAVLIAPIAQAQTPPPGDQPGAAVLPAFEVVSVKQNKTAQSWSVSTPPDGYNATGATLMTLILNAYDIRPNYRVIGAPSWWDDRRFDIQAKVSDADIPTLQKLNYRQRASMVQQILTDRFKLKVHREVKILPIYSLVVVKQGVLTEAPPPTDGKPVALGLRPGRGARAGQLVATNLTTAWLAAQLSGIMGRMVVDNTGLTGTYSADLHWTPDNKIMANSQAESDTSLSIFTAVEEQLGLKLVPTKGPVECLVIDHVEMPSEN